MYAQVHSDGREPRFMDTPPVTTLPREPLRRPAKSAGICHFFSRPGGCKHGERCRFRHVSESRPLSPRVSTDPESTNNQNPPPDDVDPSSLSTTVGSAITRPKDPEYYYPDGSGVFLVGGTLFKIQASLIFGSRPTTSATHEDSNAIYIEDLLPRLSDSSDDNPIELRGITAKQFRSYLLAIVCRPGDQHYDLLYKRDTRLSMLYLNTSILARRFGMTRLEGWTMETLCKIFEFPSSPLAELTSNPWTNTTLMRLIAFSHGTKLSRPAITFIHYFISVNLKERTGQDKPFDSPNALVCVDIYNDLKDSSSSPILFGCVFLGLLSLGHRSSIWSLNLSGKDRAIFYAAQAQLIDIANELQIFKWLRPDPVLDPRTPFCSKCKWRITTLWQQCFGELIKGLGSGLPLKDVSLLFSIPQSYWKFHIEWNQYPLFHCEQNSGARDRGIYTTFLRSLEANIQKMFEEVGSRYKTFASEVQGLHS